MRKRECFFECVFASEGNEYQFHFRAWDEVEAEFHFRERLREYGVRSPGFLLIKDVKGQVLRRADYAPGAAQDASP